MGYWDELTTRMGDLLVTPQASPWGALLPPPTPQDRRAMIAQGLLTLGGTLAQGGAQGQPTMASLGQGFQSLTEQGARRGQQQLQGMMIGSKLAETKRKNETREALKRNPPPGMTPEMIDFLPAEDIGKYWLEMAKERQFRSSAGTPSWLPGGGGGTGGGSTPTPTGGVFDVPQQFAPQVTAAATKHGVPPQLLASTFWNESRWNPNAVNPNDQGQGVNSVGLGQWGEQWAKARGFDPRDPNASIEHTAAAMKEYATKYGGNWMLARLAYGWGPGNVDKWLQAGGDPAKLPDGARVWLPRTAFGIADDQQARAAFPQVAEMLRPGPARGPWGDAQIPPMQTAGVTQPNPEQPAMPPSAANPLVPLTGQGGQLPPTSVPAPNVGQPAPPQAGPGGGYGPSLGPAAPIQAPVGAFPSLRPPQAPPEPAGAPPAGAAPAAPPSAQTPTAPPQATPLTREEALRDPVVRQSVEAMKTARNRQEYDAASARGAARVAELQKEAQTRATGGQTVTLDDGVWWVDKQGNKIQKIGPRPERNEGEGRDFTQEKELRNQYVSQTKPFAEYRGHYQRILASAEKPSAAGDIAMVYGFMKMLDPTSVVREGEFATAASAGGVPDRIVTVYNKLVSGERLTDDIRADFLDRSKRIFAKSFQEYESARTIYQKLAKDYNLNPERVAPDLSHGVTRPTFAPDASAPAGAPPSAGQPSQPPAGQPSLRWDPQQRKLVPVK